MKLTEIRKKELIQEIIGPVMVEKGLTLKKCRNGIWEWEKNIDGIVEKVHLWDMDGSLSLYIGALMGEYGGLNELLKTLEHPRTDWTEWTYWIHPEEEQLQLYENILLDMRDILVLHCDTILEKKAEKRRNRPLQRRHFEQFRDHYEQLVTEYRGKLETEDKDLSYVCEAIAEQVRVRIGRPIEEVEDDLVGYAALLASEILRQYGGNREANEKKGIIVLSDVGYKRAKEEFHPLRDIFWIWESDERIGMWKKEMKDFQDRSKHELMKGYNNLVHKPVEEITVADILEMIRQKKDFNRVFDLAMEKAVELLREDVFTGEYFTGELLERIPEMDASFFESYSDELKAIVKDALEKSKTHEWLYGAEKGEFLDMVKAVSKKL